MKRGRGPGSISSRCATLRASRSVTTARRSTPSGRGPPDSGSLAEMSGGTGAEDPPARVEVSGGQGVQVGEHGTQHNKYIETYIETQVIQQPLAPAAGQMAGPRLPGSVPQVWNIAPRNPNFTGRVPDLDGLAQALTAGPAVTVHSVRGMGGVGKTQLATEYAHAHAADYDLVWWIAADVPAAIPDQFMALAAQLGLDPVADPERLRAQVHDRLRSVPGWLLIFDNADAVAGI